MINIVPPGVVLKTVKQTGDNIVFQGTSSSNANISQLLKLIEESIFFSKPTLVSIQAVMKDGVRVNEFAVNATLREQKDAEKSTKPATGTKPTAPEPAKK